MSSPEPVAQNDGDKLLAPQTRNGINQSGARSPNMPTQVEKILLEGLEEQGVILKKWNNPYNYKIIGQLLLLYIIRITDTFSPKKIHESLQKIKLTGLLAPNTLAIYYYLLQERASTIPVIANELQIPESSAYKYTSILEENGLVHKIMKIKGSPGGGPRLQIYSVERDPDPQQVLDVRKKERKRQTPGYEFTRKATQLLMDEYLDPVDKEVTIESVSVLLSRIGIPTTLSKHHVVNESARILQQNGWRVWR